MQIMFAHISVQWTLKTPDSDFQISQSNFLIFQRELPRCKSSTTTFSLNHADVCFLCKNLCYSMFYSRKKAKIKFSFCRNYHKCWIWHNYVVCASCFYHDVKVSWPLPLTKIRCYADSCLCECVLHFDSSQRLKEKSRQRTLEFCACGLEVKFHSAAQLWTVMND